MRAVELDAVQPEPRGALLLEHAEAAVERALVADPNSEEALLRKGALQFELDALQLVRQRRMLEHLANVDGLTELANRRRFEEAFARAWASDRVMERTLKNVSGISTARASTSPRPKPVTTEPRMEPMPPITTTAKTVMMRLEPICGFTE